MSSRLSRYCQLRDNWLRIGALGVLGAAMPTASLPEPRFHAGSADAPILKSEGSSRSANVEWNAPSWQGTVKPVGVNHVALLTTDIERYLEFYRDFLGFPEMQRGNEVPNAPNVYYWRDGSPENLAKEKQGRLFMVKLWVGAHQALEFFPSPTPIAKGKKLHHVAVGFEDPEAVRRALLAVGAQAPAQPGQGLFFTYDKNISATEVVEVPPRKAADPNAPKTRADDAISSHLLFAEIAGENLLDLRRFYVQTLGYREIVDEAGSAKEAPADVRLDIGPHGDHIVLKPGKMPYPLIGFGVKSLESARAFLERSPWRSNYRKPIRVERRNGRRCIVLEDPEGVRVVLVERP